MTPGRGEIWSWLGAPTDQVGSVNEPRTEVEFGHKWNEKWVYRSTDGTEVRSVVLWLRYDLVGVFDAAGNRLAVPDAEGAVVP